MANKTKPDKKTITPKQILAKLTEPKRHEVLARDLGVTTAETGPVLRKMLADGAVVSEGEKRATTYSRA